MIIAVILSATRGSAGRRPHRPLSPIMLPALLILAIALAAGAEDRPSRWRISVTGDGIYRVDVTGLAATGFPVGVPSDHLRIYYGGGRALSLENRAGPHELVEISALVEDGDDGTFDRNDYLLFYGESVERWEYDPEREGFRYRKNLYTRENVYFLEIDPARGGKRAAARSGAPSASAPIRPDHYRERLHAEQERITLVQTNGLNSGYEWYWEMFRGSARNFTVEISHAAPEPVDVRVSFLPVSANTHQFRVSWNDAPIGTIEFDPRVTPGHEFRTDHIAMEGINLLGLTQLDHRSVRLDWFEVEYSRRFVARLGELRFASPANEGTVGYRLAGFDKPPRVFEHSNELVEIVDIAVRADSVVFQDLAGPSRQYLSLLPENWKAPTRIEAVTEDPQAAGGADYLVIAHADFMEAATRLAEWRGLDDRFGTPLAARAVDVQQIYDAFSGGLLDPAAIRNFLGFARETWEPPPLYVTLMGDGTYDYKDNSGLDPGNWIPAYQEGANMYDEWYVRVSGDDRLPDLAIGRLPVTSAREAHGVVDKLIAYDSEPEPGPWQSRVLLVAADLSNPDKADKVETEFLLDAERMAAEFLPDDLDLRKLYLAAFPLEGRVKPEARDEFIRLFNDGALLITYLGHGNPDVLAHEEMFVLSRDQGSIANGRRLPLLYTAASQVGPFDRFNGQTLPEVMVNQPDGGAIGVVSATRIGFHPTNVLLANQFHEQMFRSGRKHVPIGVALMESKRILEAGGLQRSVQRYSLFGDPATHLARPLYRVELEIADTLQALQEVALTGSVLDIQGRAAAGYSGKVLVHVFDSAVPSRLDTLTYERLGGTLFRGQAAVRAGRFEARFRMPKDITYRAQKGRITAYAWSDGEPAAFGMVSDLVLAGTAEGVTPDDTGPEVRIGFRGQPDFQSGDVVGQRSDLLVNLSDPSGINVTGSTGHDIELRLDDEVFPLTDLYDPDEGTYQQGTLLFELPRLDPGEHTLRLRAWDSFNNTTQETILFRIEESRAAVESLLFYPNPVRGQGHFTFETDADVDRVSVAVFSIAGKLVEEFVADGERGFNQIAWNPPRHLANGSYLCRVSTLANNGQTAAETVVVLVQR